MKPYEPNILPLNRLNYKQLFALVGDANEELAHYDGLLEGVVNPSIMLSPLTNEEAVLSSKIEGTQATVDEVLEQEAGIIKDGEKAQDIHEIVNYREALISAHKIHKPTAMGLLRQLKSENILKELRPGSGRRAAVLCFPELLNITEGRKII